jgi:phage terminase large subunit-like protein
MAEIATLPPEARQELLTHWPFWARPEQIAPEGKWHTWLILAGRGWGKTRTAAEWCRDVVCGSTPLAPGAYGRLAIVAETAADCRDVVVEGESGVLNVHAKEFRPVYEPSKRRLTWPNGAMATLFSAEDPDQLRGPQHDAAWLDELAKWRYAQETWDMLQFGLRLGDDPRQVITTTPRPIPLLKQIMNDPGTVITRGVTTDNRSNLPKKFFDQIVKRYEGTRLGRQELSGEILDDVPGALWTRRGLDEHRWPLRKRLPDMQRVVVAIDPATADPNKSMPDEGADTGIICAGMGVDGRGYVLEDGTCRLGPMGWARRAIALFDRYQGDVIVAEANQGGAMVEAVLRAERPTLPIIMVHASRGKVTRAEPVAALYEQGRVSHVGAHAALEDQMVLFTPNGIEGETTADRVDACVWAFTELFPSMIHRPEQDEDDDPWQRNRGRSQETGY